jgi:hypothetical protein
MGLVLSSAICLKQTLMLLIAVFMDLTSQPRNICFMAMSLEKVSKINIITMQYNYWMIDTDTIGLCQITQKILFETVGQGEGSIFWVDISFDYSSIVFCVEGNIKLNHNVPWYFDNSGCKNIFKWSQSEIPWNI